MRSPRRPANWRSNSLIDRAGWIGRSGRCRWHVATECRETLRESAPHVRRIIRVLKEFKAFIMSGNLVEIAVGLVVAEEDRTLRALLVGRLREGERMGPS
jgi:hypothetical protein